jgi:DNA-binding NtrC family response regulator
MEIACEKILIIDDAGFARVCLAILENEGFNVATIHFADKTATKPNLEACTLVITSYLHELSFLEEIKNLALPVIVLADQISRELLTLLEDVEKSFCMIKPLDYKKFILLVRQLMNGEFQSLGGYNIV